MRAAVVVAGARRSIGVPTIASILCLQLADRPNLHNDTIASMRAVLYMEEGSALVIICLAFGRTRSRKALGTRAGSGLAMPRVLLRSGC